MFALVPALLAAVAMLGFLDLSTVWEENVAPRLREQLSPAGFEVVSATVERVLSSQQGYWLTFGLGIALWQLSGAARATMRALNDIYDAEESRSLVRRFGVSLVIAVVSAVGVLGAVAALEVLPRLAGGTLGIAARVGGIAVAAVLLIGVLAVVLRLSPAVAQPPHWLGFATIVIVAGWLVGSAAYAAWVSWVVSYSSIYGGFAVVILLGTYVYLLALVFLAGTQIDALAREHSSR